MAMNPRILGLWAGLAAAAAGQEAGAALSGLILDPSGALIHKAAVELKSVSTGLTVETASNAAGVYRLRGLAPGDYVLTVRHPGFAPARTGFTLRTGDVLQRDWTLAAAPGLTTVEVRAEAAGLLTATAAASTNVTAREIAGLPLNGRQLQNLALITPAASAGWNLSTAANRYGKARENTEGAITVNGSRPRASNFVVDGMPMNLRQYSVINFEPSNEAVAEFEIQESIPPAEYGRSAGPFIQITTRSGTGRFHGSLYEFFRNDALDANDTFRKRAGLPRGRVRQNQFGGTLGGPLTPSRKHFFFFNAEFLRNVEASESRLTSVPTAAERIGRIAHEGGVLDLSGRLNPVSRRLLDLYPAPNTADPVLNYTANLAIALDDYQYHLKTDHQLTARDTVALRASWNLNGQTYVINRFGGPFIPGFALPNPELTGNGTLGWTRTFAGGALNQFRFGVNRYENPLANGDRNAAAEFGLPNGAAVAGLPSVQFDAGNLERLGGLPWFNRDQNELHVFVADSFALTRGAHALRFGGEFSRLRYNTRGAYDQRGTLYFDGSRGGLLPNTPGNARARALADFLLGLPYQATITTGAFGRGYRQSSWALYLQDSWRVNRRLTAEFGVRYDYAGPWSEVNGKLANLAGGVLATPATGLGDLYRPDRNNFAPRLGLAFRASDSTVLRAGFAVLYETNLQANSVQILEDNAPFSAAAVTRSPAPFPGSGPATALLDLRAQARPSTALGAIAPNSFRNPYAAQFAFSAERLLAGGWIATAGYAGSSGVRLPLIYNANQTPLASLSAAARGELEAAVAAGRDTTPILQRLRPYPGFDAVNLSANIAHSSYHALQAKLVRYWTSRFSMLAAYAFSKSIDNASDFSSADPSEQVLNSYNLAAQRGPSSFDIPHRFTIAGSWQPFSPRAGALLSGWQLHWNGRFQSGQPFTPFVSVFDPYRNESFNRPDALGAGPAPPGFAFDPRSFAPPRAGAFGNAGRNVVRGDGFRSLDLSVFRIFTLREGFRLEARGEFLNALNQTNFQGPNTNLSSGAAGQFVAAAPARLIQLGLKLAF